jgi:hypothetical protein
MSGSDLEIVVDDPTAPEANSPAVINEVSVTTAI